MSESSSSTLARTAREVAEDLALSLGEEKSLEIIQAAAAHLRLSEPFRPGEVDAMLQWLARSPGLVGITARFLCSRDHRKRRAAQTPEIETARPPPVLRASTRHAKDHRAPTAFVDSTQPEPNPRPRPQPETRIAVERIAELLAASLGREKAEDCIRAAMREIGIEDEELDMGQTIAVLDWLAGVGGIVAVTARFVKARVILLFSPH
jgi:hypothetical protein